MSDSTAINSRSEHTDSIKSFVYVCVYVKVNKTLTLSVDVAKALEENEPDGKQSQKVEDLLKEEYGL